MAQATPRHSTKRAPRQSFYLFDDAQSAALEEHRLALHCLADLAGGDLNGGPDEEVTLKRAQLGALFGVLEAHLGRTMGPEAVGHAWLDPRIVVSAARS